MVKKRAAVRVLWGTKIAQGAVCGSWRGVPGQKRFGEQRFPDIRLAGEQHHLAFAGLYHGPAPDQQFGSFFQPDRGSEAAACSASRLLNCLVLELVVGFEPVRLDRWTGVSRVLTCAGRPATRAAARGVVRGGDRVAGTALGCGMPRSSASPMAASSTAAPWRSSSSGARP